MNQKTPITYLIIMLMFLSCDQENETKENPSLDTDNLPTISNKEVDEERLEKRRKIEEKAYADSLILDQVLQKALKIANQNMSKDKFIQNYNVSLDRSTFSVELVLDNHFTKANPHLVIRRKGPSDVYIDIYSKGDQGYKRVLSHKEWVLTYVSDTIRDVNGDELNDFVVNWYGSTGCCLKAFSIVYLQQDKNTFSEAFEFINPTFSPQEQVIRGVCYGHRGETELYKFRWNGNQIDTLEYVSYEKNDKRIKTGNVVLSTTKPFRDNFEVLKILNSVPQEYRKIQGFDWFTGEENE